MSEKTRKYNEREDELNQSRFFAQRGAEVVETEEPSEEGPEVEEEDILDSKSRFRELPPDPESKDAENSRFYGQGFGSGNDSGMNREPRTEKKDDEESLGA